MPEWPPLIKHWISFEFELKISKLYINPFELYNPTMLFSFEKPFPLITNLLFNTGLADVGEYEIIVGVVCEL